MSTTRVRSFSILIVSFHIFYKGMCIPVCVLKGKKKKRKEGRKEGKKKEKKVGGIKDCVQGSRSSLEAGSLRLQIVALNR